MKKFLLILLLCNSAHAADFVIQSAAIYEDEPGQREIDVYYFPTN